MTLPYLREAGSTGERLWLDLLINKLRGKSYSCSKVISGEQERTAPGALPSYSPSPGCWVAQGSGSCMKVRSFGSRISITPSSLLSQAPKLQRVLFSWTSESCELARQIFSVQKRGLAIPVFSASSSSVILKVWVFDCRHVTP